MAGPLTGLLVVAIEPALAAPAGTDRRPTFSSFAAAALLIDGAAFTV